MLLVKVFTTIALIHLSMVVSGTVLIKTTIEEHVEKSSLIIKGTLINKYSKNDFDVIEYSVNGKGEETGSKSGAIYTTYVFRIDEVLKGNYDNKTIEVKKQGGCNSLGECEGGILEYDYEKGEQGVILLKKMYKLPVVHLGKALKKISYS
ncbi:MAG: hypothetical protein R3E90_11720 [Marinicella sp.]